MAYFINGRKKVVHYKGITDINKINDCKKGKNVV